MKEDTQSLPPATRNALKDAISGMAPDMTEEEVFEELEKTKYGTVRNTRDNCTKVFRHDPLLREALRLNLLSGRISIGNVPGTRSPTRTSAGSICMWSRHTALLPRN